MSGRYGVMQYEVGYRLIRVEIIRGLRAFLSVQIPTDGPDCRVRSDR